MRGGGSELTAVISNSGDTKFYPTLDISQNVLRHSEVTKSLSILDIGEDFSRHSEGFCPTESSLSLTSKAGLLRLRPRNDINVSKLHKNCFNSGNKYHICYVVFMKKSNILEIADGTIVKVLRLLRSLNSLAMTECVQSKNTSCHSEQSEESISMPISNVKDSSVTSFPQNDDSSLRYCEGAKPLSALNVGEEFPRHSELCEESISKSISNVKDSSVTSSPQNDEKKVAFTLAEVLITLGIIGVVAALTIPTLISNYQKLVLKNQFKKTYSMLSQNMLKSELDFGMQPACHYYSMGCLPHYCVERNPNGTCKRYEMADGSPLSSDVCGLSSECGSFSQIFMNNLKVIKVCDKKSYEKGCITYLKGSDEVARENNPDITDEDINKNLSGTSGWFGNVVRNNSIAYVLADGQVIFSYSYPYSTKLFAVDINGKKGPNKWGYDVFAFSSNGEPGKGIIFKGSGFSEKGGTSTANMIINMNK